MIAAADARALRLFELDKFGLAQAWPMQWSVGYPCSSAPTRWLPARGLDQREHIALLFCRA
jgi:hypothetical protein